MRNGETHFEQVPLELAVTVFRQAAERARMLEKSPAPVSELERRAAAEFLKQEEIVRVQGRAMKRMIWVKSAHSEVWACSECAWVFNPSGPPRGASLNEMKQNFERQRDKEFASHVCAQHPRTKSQEAATRSDKDEP
jgi:rubredoxin